MIIFDWYNSNSLWLNGVRGFQYFCFWYSFSSNNYIPPLNGFLSILLLRDCMQWPHFIRENIVAMYSFVENWFYTILGDIIKSYVSIVDESWVKSKLNPLRRVFFINVVNSIPSKLSKLLIFFEYFILKVYQVVWVTFDKGERFK